MTPLPRLAIAGYAVGLWHRDGRGLELPGARVSRDRRTLLPDASLSPGAAILGPVTAPDGRPVAGARVLVPRGFPVHDGSEADKLYGALGVPPSDSDGRFRIAGLADGTGGRIEQEVRVEEGKVTEVTLRLGEDKDSARLLGRLLSEGTPVAATGFVFRRADRDPRNPADYREGRTDGEGRFDLAGLRPGDFILHVRGISLPLSVSGTGTVRRDIELPAGRLRGRVVREEDGTPVAGARVRLIGGDHLASGDTTTASDGSFSLDGARTGPADVVVTAAGLAPFASGRIDVSEAGTDVVARLARGVTVTFIVHGPDGLAAPGSMVYLADFPGLDGLRVDVGGRVNARLAPGPHRVIVHATDLPHRAFNV
ncbi:MAG: carboxypeptidase regulatory-like domain-containing protein [Planctomycetes bacterium]|jgi:hypothetical protein|nr:carboxypeptidase regulatory-like domain-containing protein [Planctomycetota bacterium]